MTRLGRIGLLLVLTLSAGALVPASAAVHLGTISVGAGYGYYGGPYWPGYWAGYYPPPFYGPGFGPWFADPFYGPVYLAPQPDKGQINLQTSDKNAAVYLDGAYAGPASKLKNFWLAPGVYQLEVRPMGHAPIEKRVYVLTGKTLKIRME
jgi:PEGA domain